MTIEKLGKSINFIIKYLLKIILCVCQKLQAQDEYFEDFLFTTGGTELSGARPLVDYKTLVTKRPC
jgi:hypothetical protein